MSVHVCDFAKGVLFHWCKDALSSATFQKKFLRFLLKSTISKRSISNINLTGIVTFGDTITCMK
jgi:hypothetical protein